MELRNKNILIISPESWDHIFVSKHHYAVSLAERGNKVFFLNPPSDGEGVHSTPYRNLFTVEYTGFVKGLRFFPSFLERRETAKVFHDLQQLCDVRFDVVWSFDNSVFYRFDALPSSVVAISHIVDLNQDFQTKAAASTADICFCTTDYIAARLKRYSNNVYKINHGYHESGCENFIQLPGNGRIKAVYSGNLSMPYLDWQIMYSIARLNPDVDFVLIGPGAENVDIDVNPLHDFKKSLLSFSNVFSIGKVSANEVLCYLRSADILLVCYQEKFFEEQANPHKIMEYLGSGKVVVATYTEEYNHVGKDLILMSRKNNDWPSLVSKALDNLSLYNAASLQQQRIKFALGNTYEKQIERIEDLISGNS